MWEMAASRTGVKPELQLANEDTALLLLLGSLFPFS